MRVIGRYDLVDIQMLPFHPIVVWYFYCWLVLLQQSLLEHFRRCLCDFWQLLFPNLAQILDSGGLVLQLFEQHYLIFGGKVLVWQLNSVSIRISGALELLFWEIRRLSLATAVLYTLGLSWRNIDVRGLYVNELAALVFQKVLLCLISWDELLLHILNILKPLEVGSPVATNFALEIVVA